MEVIDSNPVLTSFFVTACHSGNWAWKSHKLKCESCLSFNGCNWGAVYLVWTSVSCQLNKDIHTSKESYKT